MCFKATVEFGLKDEHSAKMLLRSIEVDNQGFVETEVIGARLICRVEAKTVASLRHTLDDLLACADIAESILVRDNKV